MLKFARRGLPLVVVAAVALWLRTHELARRPMHADEANQAVKFGELLEHGAYAFDPLDHHGPTLYYFALLPAWLRGERTLASLQETTVRLTPAVFGTLAVLLVAALAAPLGRWPAVAAASLVAVSPTAVYYSRYFIQETLLLTFTLAVFVGAWRWWRTGRVAWAIATGVCAGLMLATKATAPVFLAGGALAAWVARPPRAAGVAHWVRDFSCALLAALMVAALFFTAFGAHLDGLQGAMDSFGFGAARAIGASGHEKPWWYYGSLFLFQRHGGYGFDQSLFLFLGGCGVIAAWGLPPQDGGGWPVRWPTVYVLFLALVLSAVPYKTPWIAIHFVPPLALLGAGALAAGAQQRPWAKFIATPILLATLAWQFAQVQRVAFRLPADPRNPFAYVHSAPDVLKVRALADAALDRAPDGIVKIISEEYWPLPWYLRGAPRVGYWESPPEDCDGALVIASADLADAVRARLHGAYQESFLGLRPGFVLIVFTPVPR